ncbi:hypothetical protein [Dactylosporangium sp. CA-092794]|uniref:hypothetical protein n=1 Tax=Dactylosporangium sp. CA-092794 TaxID=3239929 RepID=UPI003D8F733F
MSTTTAIRGLTANHNETVVRREHPLSSNHNETVVSPKADGALSSNHNETVVGRALASNHNETVVVAPARPAAGR